MHTHTLTPVEEEEGNGIARLTGDEVVASSLKGGRARHPKLSLCVYVCAVLCVSVYTHYSVYVLMNMCVCVSVPMKR